MALRIRLRLKRLVQKLRRRKGTGKEPSIQNAFQINAGGVAAIGQVFVEPQHALHLSNEEGFGSCRLLDLPVELLLQILELLWESASFRSRKEQYSLPSLRLLVHYHS